MKKQKQQENKSLMSAINFQYYPATYILRNLSYTSR